MAPEQADELDEEFLHHWSRGNALYTVGDYEPASRALSRALRLRPKDVRVLSLLAVARYRLKQFEQAAELYAALVEASPAEPSLRMNLGLALMNARRFSQAALHLALVLEQRPDHTRAMSLLGLAHLAMADPVTARSWFARAGNKEGLARCDQAEASGMAATAAFPAAAPDVSPGARLHVAPCLPEAPSDPCTSPQCTSTVEGASLDAPEVQLPDCAASLAILPVRPELRAPPSAVEAPAAGSMLGRFVASQLTPVHDVDQRPVSFDGVILRLRIHEAWHASLAGLFGVCGKLDMAPTMKRRRGRDSELPFGHGARLVHKVSGRGSLLFHAENRHFSAVSIDRDAGYFREEVVFAFQGSVDFENGRIAAWPGPDVDVVFMQGRGWFVLETAGEIATVKVSAGEPLSVPVTALVGWLGELTPRTVTLDRPLAVASPEGGAHCETLIELTGDGTALVDPAAAARQPEGRAQVLATPARAGELPWRAPSEAGGI